MTIETAGLLAKFAIRLLPGLLLVARLGAAEAPQAVSLQPAPWKDGEELRFEIKFPTGYKVGAAFYSVEAGELDGQPIWQTGSRLFSGVHSFSRTQVDAGSFRPIHSRWKHSLIGEVEAHYTSTQAVLKQKGQEDKKIDLKEVVYDNESAFQLLRRLPLTNGYATNLRFLSSLGGGTVLPVRITVTAREPVGVPAGKFDCYKVELSLHQTCWYSTDPQRYLVKFENGGVTGELREIFQRKGRQQEKYVEPAFGFSLAAPADWRFYRADDPEDRDKTVVLLLDPEAVANSSLRVQNQSTLKPEMLASLRRWAEAQMTRSARPMQIRPDSWKQRTVAGHPALSVMADYTEGKEKKIAYAIYTFGATNAAAFQLEVGADDFEGFRPKFEAMLEGYRAN